MTAKKKETALHRKLAAELADLIPLLDEEGLAFLVEQANVHLYNRGIERLNADLEEAERMASGAAAGKTGRKGRGASPATPGQAEAAPLRIERSPSGSSYHLVAGGKWKMFSDSEMLSMVKIAQAKDPVPEVAGRLYAWLSAERPDAFVDLDIAGANDPKLSGLVALLRAKFAIRG